MIGAFGALACTAFCTFAGLYARDRCRTRLAALESWTAALATMRLLLEEERLPLDDLLDEASQAVRDTEAGHALRRIASALTIDPSLTLMQAFDAAPVETERAVLAACFRQMGSGTAAMRAQAVEQAQRKLTLCEERTRQKAETNGVLYAKLGLLGGLTLGIALW